jgi:hypothetical protein
MIEERLQIIKQKLKDTIIPKSIALNSYTIITNPELFIESHLGYAETYKNFEGIANPYLKRLEEFLAIIRNEHLHGEIKS